MGGDRSGGTPEPVAEVKRERYFRRPSGAEEKFGFHARKVGAYVDSMVMGVEAIHTGGVLARYNFSQPESAIRVDDVVLAINGTHQGQKGLQIRAREP